MCVSRRPAYRLIVCFLALSRVYVCVCIFVCRCMISSIATGDPFRDFRVVYKTHSGMERVFERKDGKTLNGSDPRLQEPPPFLMARLCMFRAIPLDLEMYNP